MNTIEDFEMSLFSLEDKVAIVTGGNKGIGLAMAYALKKAGAKLFIVTHGKDWQEADDLLSNLGQGHTFFQADLSDKKQIDDVVTHCLKQWGKVDILVNNAGTIKRAPLLEYKDEDWEKVIDVNQHAVYYLSQRVAVQFAKQKSGKIINIASMLSFQGGKFVPSYTASKHAVVGITKAFANELAESGINVNAIAPGYVKTKNTAAIREDDDRNEEIENRIPAGRWAAPHDLMGSVVYLASSASDYVNGHVLAVDGGWLSS